MNAVNWFFQNWVAILAILTGAYLVVTDFVMLTPTKADDAILAKVTAALVSLGWKPPQR